MFAICSPQHYAPRSNLSNGIPITKTGLWFYLWD